MNDVAIRVDNLSKMYRIGGRQERYKRFTETVMDTLAAPVRRVRRLGQPTLPEETIWALKDVSFEVQRGEVVGIIGRNGAGKTTLLKILSRITEPTEGQAIINGRVGSLLEVGTGFHPELTGRENITLNGAVLGMKRAEIDRKFDEIVAFSGVEKFIDTPVKHYSSGMYVRLAFAVAAHLEPEILLVDEVLAVGDAEFQRRCLGKMRDVTEEGRTVLFVSHNLRSVANLCPRAILLVRGKKWCEGPSGDVINEYITMGTEYQGERVWHNLQTAPGNEKVRLHAVRIVSGGKVTTDVDIQKDIHVEVEFWNLKSGAKITTNVGLLDKTGVVVLDSMNIHSVNLIRDEWFGKPHPAGLYRAVCTIPGNLLNEGMYSISAFVFTDVTDITHLEVAAREVVSFAVHDTSALRQEYGGAWVGVVRLKLAWQTEYLKPLNEGLGGYSR